MADEQMTLAARGESLAAFDGRGAPPARRGDREYREYLSEEQRSRRRGPQRGSRVGVAWGCIARRMQPDFHHGLLTNAEQIVFSRRVGRRAFLGATAGATLS